MGQQQLLLLVLATVIVGLATVAGIQAFDQNQKRFNKDARRQLAADMLSDLKALDSRPSETGGFDWYKGGPRYWEEEKNMRELLNRMGYDTKIRNGVVVVSARDGEGWCYLNINDDTGSVSCYGPTGDFSQRLYGTYNRDDEGSLYFYN